MLSNKRSDCRDNGIYNFLQLVSSWCSQAIRFGKLIPIAHKNGVYATVFHHVSWSSFSHILHKCLDSFLVLIIAYRECVLYSAFPKVRNDAVRGGFFGRLGAVYYWMFHFWPCHVILGWSITWFPVQNLTIQYLIVQQLGFILVHLAVIGKFKLFRPQSFYLGFFGMSLLRCVHRLIWRLVCHNWPMLQLVGILCRDQKVKARTSWMVVANVWLNAMFRMTAMSTFLFQETKVRR